MPLLIYKSSGNTIIEREFKTRISIGTADNNSLRLTEDLMVDPTHTVISQSTTFLVPILVDLTGENGITQVNGRRVVNIKALRHRDRIRLGNLQIEFWEFKISQIKPGTPFIGSKCPFCYDDLQVGDEVVTCPRCQTPHHKGCWFCLTYCTKYACLYPVQNSVRRTLSNLIHFEKLDEKSRLVTKNIRCTAGNPHDQMPFKAGALVAYCPDCNIPFHVECWLGLERCPTQGCNYDVGRTIETFFATGSLPDEIL